ncbi:hypothetical protein [Delftia phage PhiW-14]|uniref:Uncharacterized protein n=1 Tax=Delftia phage PhiW-14 TaxID=665032 RepID=C9DGF2_BPW14|nr:hypothetical protein DP-phiW-14_gp182 [Delftia phage PhiW-14]ACV50203.1 hypothetical protein [Delftia phage PhiW-14]
MTNIYLASAMTGAHIQGAYSTEQEARQALQALAFEMAAGQITWAKTIYGWEGTARDEHHMHAISITELELGAPLEVV